MPGEWWHHFCCSKSTNLLFMKKYALPVEAVVGHALVGPLGARKAQHGGRIMSCVLGLFIAIAVGLLVVCVVTWTTRFPGMSQWLYTHCARWRAYVAVQPVARATGTQYKAQPQHHDCRHRDGSISSLAPPEDDVWKVLTFVYHMPRLSIEERQRLLATWRDSHHAGARPEHARH